MTPAARSGDPNHAAAPTTIAANTRTNRQPRTSGARVRNVAERSEGFERHATLVVGDGSVGPDDRLLVALAGKQDDVAGPSALERGGDRRRAVGDQEQVSAATLAAVLAAAGDVLENRLAVLAARVLVGHDHEACLLGRDAAHHRPLLRVALPGGPEHGDHSPTAGGGQWRQQPEDLLERRRGGGVVDDDTERLAATEPLHPARHTREPFETCANGRRIQCEDL